MTVAVLGAGSMIVPRLIEILSDRYPLVACYGRKAISLDDMALPSGMLVVSLLPMMSDAWRSALPKLASSKRIVAFGSTNVFTRADRSAGKDLAVAETRFIQFCAVRGIEWPILRPTLIYSPPHDKTVTALAGVWLDHSTK